MLGEAEIQSHHLGLLGRNLIRNVLALF